MDAMASYLEKENIKTVQEEDLVSFFTPLFDAQINDLPKSVDYLTEWNDNLNAIEKLKPYIFDLMLLHWFFSFAEEEGFFESAEWEIIEEKSIDLGTELFPLLMYIWECKEEEMEIEIEDYLFNYLMGEDDMEQDQIAVYEPLIKNYALVNEPFNSSKIIKEKNKNSEISEFILPILLLFNHQKNEVDRTKWLHENGDGLEVFIYETIKGINKV